MADLHAPSAEALARLLAAREAEKRQTLFYRALAAEAEGRGDEDVAERLNGLLADEQHHLSRLSARLLELGVVLPEVGDVEAPAVDYEVWEAMAAQREHEEVLRYEGVPLEGLDERTAEVVAEILDAERQHARELGGKWMKA